MIDDNETPDFVRQTRVPDEFRVLGAIDPLSQSANILLREISKIANSALFSLHGGDEYDKQLNQMQAHLSALYSIRGAYLTKHGLKPRDMLA